jgi:hypothetical protein
MVFLISSYYANAQDTLQSHIENGKFYGIFPVVEKYVVYADTVVFAGAVNKEGIYDKAKAFFDKKEDANYYFESEDKDAGELIYQGELRNGMMSQKSDVHFNLVLHFSDSICRFQLYEVVLASSQAKYTQMAGGAPGQMHTGSVETGTVDRAIQLENINVDKGEFSRRYCEKMNKRFAAIMEGLGAALRLN